MNLRSFVSRIISGKRFSSQSKPDPRLHQAARSVIEQLEGRTYLSGPHFEGQQYSEQPTIYTQGDQGWSYTIDWGDGSPTEDYTGWDGSSDPAAFQVDLDLEHYYDDNAGLTVTDHWSWLGGGAYPVFGDDVAFGDDILNVQPTANFQFQIENSNDSTITVSLTDPSDPSQADTNAGFHYSFAADPDDLAQDYASAGTSNSATFAYSSGPVIYGRIFDKDSGYSDYSTNDSTLPTINAPSVTPTGVTLAWLDTTDGQAAGWRVRRSDDGGQTYDTHWTLSADATSFEDDSVQPDKSYLYIVRAIGQANYVGQTAFSLPTQVDTPGTLTAPGNLTATPTSSTQIALSWSDPNNNEDGYSVEKSSDGVNFTPITPSLPANTTSYTVSGLSAGPMYYFRVQALSGSLGNSVYSSVAQAAIPPVPMPQVSLSVVSSQQVKLDIVDLEQSAVRYEIYLDDGYDGPQLDGTITPSDSLDTTYNPAVQEGLLNGYFVRAYNDLGEYADSSVVSYQAPPLTPGFEHLSYASPSEVDIIANAEESLHMSGWEVDQSISPTFDTIQNTYDQPERDDLIQADGPFSPATTYYFRARSYEELGDGSTIYSDYSYSDPLYTPPSAPSDVSVSDVHSTHATLSWTATAGENPDGFEIQASANGGDFETLATVGDVQSYELTGLDPSTNYQFQVVGTYNGAESDPSDSATATTQAYLPAASITGVTPIGTPPSQVRIDYSVNLDGVSTTGLSVIVLESIDGGDYTPAGSFSPGDTVDVPITDGHSYDFELELDRSDDANSADSSSNSYVSPLLAPSDVLVDDLSGVSPTVSWTNHSQGASGYNLYTIDPDGDEELQDVVGPDATSDTIYGLDEFTTYTFEVQAFGDNGMTSSKATHDATTGLFAPSDADAEGISASEINLTWDDNSMQEDGYLITYWQDGQADAPGAKVSIYAPENATGMPIIGLAPSTNYDFQVQAFKLVTNPDNSVSTVYSDSTSATSGTTAAIDPSDPPPTSDIVPPQTPYYPPGTTLYRWTFTGEPSNVSPYSNSGNLIFTGQSDWALDAGTLDDALANITGTIITTNVNDGSQVTYSFPEDSAEDPSAAFYIERTSPVSAVISFENDTELGEHDAGEWLLFTESETIGSDDPLPTPPSAPTLPSTPPAGKPYVSISGTAGTGDDADKATFTVSRYGDTSEDLTVQLFPAAGDAASGVAGQDLEGMPTSVTIRAGDSSASFTITTSSVSGDGSTVVAILKADRNYWLTSASVLALEVVPKQMSAQDLLVKSLEDEQKRIENTAFWHAAGVDVMFQRLITEAQGTDVEYKTPQQMAAKAGQPVQALFVKPLIGAGSIWIQKTYNDPITGLHETLHAYVSSHGGLTNDWTDEGMAWGMETTLVDAENYLMERIESIPSGPNGELARVRWTSAWAVILDVYKVQVTNVPGQDVLPAHLKEVKQLLGYGLSEGTLRPIYQQLLAQHGVTEADQNHSPVVLPTPPIPPGDPLQ